MIKPKNIGWKLRIWNSILIFVLSLLSFNISLNAQNHCDEKKSEHRQHAEIFKKMRADFIAKELTLTPSETQLVLEKLNDLDKSRVAFIKWDNEAYHQLSEKKQVTSQELEDYFCMQCDGKIRLDKEQRAAMSELSKQIDPAKVLKLERALKKFYFEVMKSKKIKKRSFFDDTY